VDDQQSHIYEFGDFRLNASRRLLTGRDGRVVPLTPKPFDTLLYLVQHSGTVLDKDELMRAVWPDTVVEENNLSQSISALRRALGEKPGQHRYIVTVPGRGFRFVAAVSMSGGDDSKNKPEAASSSAASSTVAATQTARPTFASRRRLQIIAVVLLLAVVLSLAGFLFWHARIRSTGVSPSSPSTTLIKTIAVLPFKPLVPNEQDQALEMGMADTLIAKLSNSSEIIVRPISAVRGYGGLDQDPQSAGRALNVDAVLDGSIHRQADRIRVTARLLNVLSGKQIWSGQFDEKMTDIFTVQDSISERVTAALALKLTGAEQARLKRRDTENIDAYQLCLRGRYFLSKRRPEALKQALEYFQQAIALDANYALAYANLADTYGFLSNAEYGETPPKEVIPKAKVAAQRAIAIDDTLAEAHAALGRTLGFERDWEGAGRELRRAIQLDPNNADGLRYYSVYLARMGNLDEAVAEARRAWQIEPGAAGRMMVLGWIHYYRREYDQAIEQCQQALDIDQNFYSARLKLGMAYVQKGMFDQAITELQKSVEQSGRNARHLAFLGYAYALSGRRDQAKQVLTELENRSAQNPFCFYGIGLIHLGLGDKQSALDWLEKADQERDDWLLFLKIEPAMDTLRTEPRFRELMRRVGFQN
jgi:DNA-binding winged helix-turn-helix (wHTH) protein/TolB-like protein/Flp pilus assembly protein TadD